MNDQPRIAPRNVDAANNTYALLIRNNILAWLQQQSYFANFKTFRTTRKMPAKVADLPYLGVYIVNEAGGPDGDINHWAPHCTVNVRIGFSVWIANNDEVATENQLDGAFRAIMRAILEYPVIYNNANSRVEGFASYTRSHYYGNTQLDNESSVAEMRAELVCRYREYYGYVAVDDFKTMNFKTAWPSPSESDGVQQIEAIWDLPQ